MHRLHEVGEGAIRGKDLVEGVCFGPEAAPGIALADNAGHM